MLSSESETRDVITLTSDQVSALLHHVRIRGEQKVGEIASQFGVSEADLIEFWQVNRTRWPEIIEAAEAVDRKKVTSGAWMPHEDAQIQAMIYTKGENRGWKEIARRLGRTVDQVKNHYQTELRDKVKTWTPQDNCDLILLQKELRSDWEKIAMRMNRTIIDVEMRCRFLNTQPGQELLGGANISSDDADYQELEDEQTVEQASPVAKGVEEES
jgi:hypothetical protein